MQFNTKLFLCSLNLKCGRNDISVVIERTGNSTMLRKILLFFFPLTRNRNNLLWVEQMYTSKHAIRFPMSQKVLSWISYIIFASYLYGLRVVKYITNRVDRFLLSFVCKHFILSCFSFFLLRLTYKIHKYVLQFFICGKI